MPGLSLAEQPRKRELRNHGSVRVELGSWGGGEWLFRKQVVPLKAFGKCTNKCTKTAPAEGLGFISSQDERPCSTPSPLDSVVFPSAEAGGQCCPGTAGTRGFPRATSGFCTAFLPHVGLL